MKLTEYEDTRLTQRVLVTGFSGTGKTTLAATLSEHFNVLWIDCENAIETLVKLPRKQKERINVIKIPDSAALPISATTVQHLFRYLKANICEDHGMVECKVCKRDNKAIQVIDLTTLNPRTDVVVLDSLTQIGYSFLNKITSGQQIDYKPERDDWGGLRRYTEFLATNIQALPCNFIATALVSEVQLDDGRTKLVPAFGSKDMSASIAAKFSSVVYCDVKNKKHVAYSASTASNLILTKSRTGYEIESLGEPNLCPMFMRELNNVPETPVQAGDTKTIIGNKNVPNSTNPIRASVSAAKLQSPAVNAIKNLSSASGIDKK